MILVTSSFVTFWIEWNAEPARVTLGVTTMLNFFTTSNKLVIMPSKLLQTQFSLARNRINLSLIFSSSQVPV